MRLVFFLFLLRFTFVNDAEALDNQLKAHPSPYLAAHAEDPVAWQDWSQAAIDLARKENKLLYLSIGYFACHWCHVMQRESYKNKEIAAFLNKHFIPVKIDRELEPALDAYLINFAESTRGIAGWPLNVFVSPEGYPLMASLYSPPGEFLAMLKHLNILWQQDHKGLSQLARQAAVTKQPRGKSAVKFDAMDLAGVTEKFMSQAMKYADHLEGGFGRNTKFPSVPQLQLLLTRLESHPDDERLRAFLTLTLDQMMRRGLQDHLGGGFFRYTTDPGWTRPHFEKMLYDNTQLARLYLQAASIFNRDVYRELGRRTLDFLIAVFRTADGAFIASLSALDDAGVEGGYYLWSKDGLNDVLTPQERRAFMLAWGMRDAPPFEDGYLPMPDMNSANIARTLKRKPADVGMLLSRAERKVKDARRRRKLPQDTKQLAGWNGLALTAFADAARWTGDRRYRQVGEGIRDYLAQVLWNGQSLRRAVAADRAVGQVSLQDYALVAQGLLAWAELTGQKADYALALKITHRAWEQFYDDQSWRSAERELIPGLTRDIIDDGVIPSPSAVLVWTSLRLARMTENPALRSKAEEALRSGYKRLAENPFVYPTQLTVLLEYRQNLKK